MKLNQNLNKSIEDEINNICTKNTMNKNILVLAGGGMKGLALIGSIKYLEEINIIKDIEIYAGTSIGLIICVLLIVGYTSHDIYKFTKLFDIAKTLELDINNLFTKYTVTDCNNYEIVFNEMLKKKNIDPNINLLELYKLTKKKVIGTTVCLTTRKTEYISYENYPELNIITFIRMSSAVPFMFPPIIYNDKLYVDGGISDNFPIDLFIDKLENVIGINIISDYFNIKEIKNIIDYFLIIMGIFIKSATKQYTDDKYKDIVYNLNIEGLYTFSFTMTNKEKKNIFMDGYNFMKENYKN
jgi:NTE family protein